MINTDDNFVSKENFKDLRILHFDNYFEGEYFFECRDYANFNMQISHHHIKNGYINNNDKKIINFKNNQKKILFSLNPGFYHFTINYLGAIFRYKEIFKEKCCDDMKLNEIIHDINLYNDISRIEIKTFLKNVFFPNLFYFSSLFYRKIQHL